jgi:uncharacterized protein (DUF1697 family)
MIYVALLRGINVGGKSMVSMADLKQTFEQLGLTHVRSYINSGNIIFTSQQSKAALTQQIEAALVQQYGLPIRILLKTQEEMVQLVRQLPADWVQGKELKCDVVFLWPELDKPSVLTDIPSAKDYEDVRYLPGVVLRKIAYADYSKGKFQKIVGTPAYQSMTIRNTNTVRKLLALMEEA